MNDQTKKEKIRAYDREYKRKLYLKNPEKMRAIARAKYERIKADPERLKRYREYHIKYNKQYDKAYRQTEEYKVRHCERAKKWYKKNAKKIYQQRRKRPYERLASVIRARIHDVLKNGYKSDRTEKLIGISIKELKVYIENKFKSGMTWDNYGFYGWHIDHIRPLSSFDLTTPEGQKEAFHYTNLQPLWAKENLHKHSKIF